MRVWQLEGTSGSGSLALSARPIPKPGRKQLLVRVNAVSLNYRDVAIARGTYPLANKPGLIPASDCAGRVEAVGPDVTSFKVCDRVTNAFVPGWISGKATSAGFARLRGNPYDGVLAEYVLFEEEELIATPAFLTEAEAASTPCAGTSAWNALYGGGEPLKPGETVLVQGTGGVAIFALQIAHAGGAAVVVTSSSDEKLQRIAALGMWQGVNYRTHPEWHAEVRRLTENEGVHITVEIGGPGTLARSIQATRFGGTVSMVGVLTRGQVDPLTFMHRGLTLRSIGTGSREMHEALFRSMDRHRWRPLIDSVYPFEDAPAAFDRIEGGGHIGKVVIKAPESPY
ncbi:MAG TPA: NAD(P)-dependent alcohol dehydrogenase [Steroidobacteraceae bacterium]|nr:NAD(P)-dependent alcohol dehydrogenase [Steroidobacteraceae bacterium]